MHPRSTHPDPTRPDATRPDATRPGWRRLAVRALCSVAFLASTGLVACCGGGGGNGPPIGGGGPGAGDPMTAAEQQLSDDALAAMNSHRAGLGLTAYIAHPQGAQVAYDHCLDMRARNFFAHVNPDGAGPDQRIAAAGITHDPGPGISPSNFVGENLAMGTNAIQSGAAVVSGWIGSPGHHTQIDAPQPVSGAQTMPAWTHCGIGVHQGPGGTIWWTAVFLRNPVP